MNHEGPLPPRKPLAANLAWAMALSVVLCVGYAFSYAPAYRYARGPDPGFLFASADEPVLHAFRPVEWLMFNTPLSGVLLKWAKVWGVEDGIRYEYRLRIAL